MYYKDLFEQLFHNNIRYLVAGGVAVALKGIPRLTMDIDLIVDLEEANLRKTLDVLATLSYEPKLPVNPHDLLDNNIRQQWRQEKGMLVFNFHNPKQPTEQVDIFIELPRPFDELYDKREIEHLGNIEIPIVSTKHLIEMKRSAGRKQDVSDIELLEKLTRDTEKKK